MNIPSYSNQDTSKSANNKNKIVIIAGVAIAVVIIGTVLAFILLKPSDSNTTQPNITDNTDSEVPNPGTSFFCLHSPRAAPQSPNAPMVVLVPGQHQEGGASGGGLGRSCRPPSCQL